MRKKILLGSLSGIVQVAINTILVVLTVSLFIDKLGVELYGIFSLFAVIGNFNLLVNLGFNTSLIKFLVEQGRTEESNYDIITVFLVLSLILVLVTALLLFNETFVLKNIFGLSEIYLTTETSILFKTILFSSVLVILGQVPSAIFDSLQKTYLTNLLQLFYSILNKSSIIILLFVDPRLSSIGIFSLSATIIWFIILFIVAIKVWGFYRIANYSKSFIPTIKKQLKYSSKIYGSNILGFFYEPLTKILINKYIGIREVAFFEIALRIKGLFWSLIERLIYPITPLIGKLENKIQIAQIIQTVEKKLLLFGIFIIAIVCTNMHQIVQLWIGREVEIISTTANIILASYLLFALPLYPTYQYLIMKGFPEKVLILQSVNVIVNVSLFYLLLPYFNYWGAIVSFIIAVLCSFILLLKFRTKLLNIKIIENVTDLRNIILFSIILVALNGFINMFLLSTSTHIIIVIIFNSLVSFLLIRYLHLFSKEDFNIFFGENIKYKNMFSRIMISN